TEASLSDLFSFLDILHRIAQRTMIQQRREMKLLSLHEVCVDSGIFSQDESLGLQLVTKMSLLVEMYKHTEGRTVLLAEEFLNSNKLGAIVFVTPELGKWSTVGGLGVMVDELATTLAQVFDQEVDTIIHVFNLEIKIADSVWTLGIHRGFVKGVHVIFLHNAELFPQPYPDFLGVDMVKLLVAMGKGSLEALCQLRCIPQLIVTNDWMAGLTAAYAKKGFFGTTFDHTTFFHLIHNLDATYEGHIFCCNPLLCALLQCDAWGTVSPSYRDDICGRMGQHPSALAPLLNRFPNPFAYPNGIPIESREARIRSWGFKDHWDAKGALQKQYFGFESPDLSIPLFAFIGRITLQKGVHIILDAVENLVRHYEGKIQILLGGKADYRDAYSRRCAHRMWELSKRYPWSIWAKPDEFFSDGPFINLGADFGLMPSAFEPGGIVQHEFFVGGTPVIVFTCSFTAFYTGGLKDTVFEFNLETQAGNGFVFESFSSGDFLFAMERAMRVFRDSRKYNILRKNARKSVVSCEDVGKAWLKEFYHQRRKIYANPVKSRMTVKNAPAKPEETTDKHTVENVLSNGEAVFPPEIKENFVSIMGPIPSGAPPGAKLLSFSATAGRDISIEKGHIRSVTTHTHSPEPFLRKKYTSQVDGAFVIKTARIKSCDVDITTNLHSNSMEDCSVLSSKMGVAKAAVTPIPYRLKYVPPSGKPRPRSVAITGSFEDWGVRRPLSWDNALQAFVTTIPLEPGKYRYKLIVDGDWLCNPDDTTDIDEMGNINNIIEVA
ncbi:putative glycogen synthase, partial [Cardiosporidium cionae]